MKIEWCQNAKTYGVFSEAFKIESKTKQNKTKQLLNKTHLGINNYYTKNSTFLNKPLPFIKTNKVQNDEYLVKSWKNKKVAR